MGVKSELAYPYLFCEVRNPSLKGRHVRLNALGIGISWVVVKGGVCRGYNVVYVHLRIFPF